MHQKNLCHQNQSQIKFSHFSIRFSIFIKSFRFSSFSIRLFVSVYRISMTLNNAHDMKLFFLFLSLWLSYTWHTNNINVMNKRFSNGKIFYSMNCNSGKYVNRNVINVYLLLISFGFPPQTHMHKCIHSNAQKRRIRKIEKRRWWLCSWRSIVS